MIVRNVCSRSNEISAHHRVKSPLTIGEMRSWAHDFIEELCASIPIFSDQKGRGRRLADGDEAAKENGLAVLHFGKAVQRSPKQEATQLRAHARQQGFVLVGDSEVSLAWEAVSHPVRHGF